jgi:hypothetical protein
MKPSHITSIMDTALEARTLGEIFTPLFTGEAGLGKSFIVQQWVKEQRKRNPNFGFLDLRIAYMEAPDLIGFPETEKDASGEVRTKHRLPEFWPNDENSEGLILFEEPNRGTTGVLNCLMQILTDRKIHNYTLPKGWLLAGCINPDSSKYDVTTMDTALKDRFEEFEIEYDPLAFLEYIDKSDWNESVQRFIGDGIWIYKTSEELGANGKYISPRTWSKVNAAERAGTRKNRNLHRLVVTAILGKDIGNEYHRYCYDQAPVTAHELLKDQKAALAKLREHSNPDTYKGDMLASTVESMIKAYGGPKKDCKPDQIDEDLMAEVAKIIPADYAVNLIKGCGFKATKGRMSDFFGDFVKRHPELIDVLKANLKLSRATGVDKTKA